MYKNRYILLSFFLLFSCGEDQVREVEVKYEDIKEDMIEMNRGWTEEEEQIIRNYIRRRNWSMVTTGTGIRYMVYRKGDTLQPTAQEGDIVSLNYEIRMIEGDTLCYSSDGEPDAFKVAMDHVENGLHEVVTYLRKGDKAKVIMPYNRAFGLIGDMDKIPPQAPLIYDIEMMEIEREK